MIELRYIYRDGSDHGSLQYRYQYKVENWIKSEGGSYMDWSKWKFVPGVIVSTSEFDQLQKESISNE